MGSGVGAATIAVPKGVWVWLATCCTEMRKGYARLATLVRETLKCDPNRERRGDVNKCFWQHGHDQFCTIGLSSFRHCLAGTTIDVGGHTLPADRGL